MFSNMTEVNLKSGDRVAVIHDGKIIKVHVADAIENGPVMVTLAANTDAVAFDRSEVFPLYRYLTDSVGTEYGLIPFCVVRQFPKSVTE